MNVAIKIEGIGKKFRLDMGRKKLKDLIFKPGREDGNRKEFWALRDVSFEVGKGETLGVIGKNGSGKSTLFKLISRILNPDEGNIEMEGKVFPMIELNAGFHEDMSGRENIRLNGTILGMSKEKVDQAMETIIAFSELGEFIDLPVRYYSSGMYLRLGFSISISVEFDILLIDEILAVGDFRFQKKCISKIDEFKRQNKTIVYVSHDLGSVSSICDRVVWIDAGRVVEIGDPDSVIDSYVHFLEKMDS